MANANIPGGLTPVNADGRPYSGGLTRYYVPTSVTANLYRGDAFIIAGSGDADGVPSIAKATAGTGNRITGAIVGWEPNARIIADGYRAGSTAAYALCTDNPEQVYEVQATTAAATDIGANINLAAATGARLTQSATYADGAQIATTATYQLRIKSLVQRADNATGAYAKLLVTINTPTGTGAAGSTGV